MEKRIAAAVAAFNKEDSTEERDVKADAQARADVVYNELGLKGAPPPMRGEKSLSYRRRLLKEVQKHSEDWRDVDLAVLDARTMAVAEKRIYADASVSARNPSQFPEQGLVTIPTRDPVTGLTRYEFRGRQTFISELKRPSNRVTSMDTSRRAS
jgi:hypothetical protein